MLFINFYMSILHRNIDFVPDLDRRAFWRRLCYRGQQGQRWTRCSHRCSPRVGSGSDSTTSFASTVTALDGSLGPLKGAGASFDTKYGATAEHNFSPKQVAVRMELEAQIDKDFARPDETKPGAGLKHWAIFAVSHCDCISVYPRH